MKGAFIITYVRQTIYKILHNVGRKANQMKIIKLRPGCLVSDAIGYMMKRVNNKDLLGDHLNKKRCIHIAPDDDGVLDLHVHKTEGLLECRICHRTIYNRFDQSAIDIIDRCMNAILSQELLTLVFANLLHSTELIVRKHINEFYQARYVIEHEFAKARQLLKELITFVSDYGKDHEKSVNYETLKHLYPLINDETDTPEHLSSDITPISGNDVTLIDECISVIDQLLIFGMLNGLRDYAQDELLILRTALYDLVENLENSDDMNK